MNKKGFSVIEVIFAAAVFVILASGAVASTLFGFDLNRNGGENSVATQYAAQGIEAMRSIKNQNFANLINTSQTGIARNANGVWAYNGINNTFEKYTRTIKVEDVYRDTVGNVVTAGGTIDIFTKKITSTVSWNFTSSRPQTTSLTTYLTDWRRPIIGNWSNPSLQSSFDLAGNSNGVRVTVQGNYAYVIRTIGSPNFAVINITNLSAPILIGSLDFGNTPTDIAVSGNYAYVTSRDNAKELQIINISNPSAPFIVGLFNTAGNADANAISIIGTTVYLIRDSSSNPNMYAVNVSNPVSPTSLGSVSLAGNLKDIFLYGSYAYLSSADNTFEFQIINITNPANMTLVGQLNLAGNDDALSVFGYSTTVFVGRVNGDLLAINVSNPASPVTISTLNVGGDINDISIDAGHQYAFLATANGSLEFQVINISNTSSMSVFGSFNMSATQNSLYYDSTLDRVFIVGSANNAELSILQPN